MEITTMTTGTPMWSGLVAPAHSGAAAGVRPIAGDRVRTAATEQASVPTVGMADAFAGHRPWSPPIT